jgi:nitroreductase
MDADQALRTTRSVRRRIDFDRSVEPHVIEDCIRTAVQAPTGANREAWRFLVISEPDRKLALAELYRRALDAYASRADAPPRPSVRALADRMHEMPALILVCSVGRPLPDSVAQQVAFYGSVLPAAWSLMVALRARGLGATWTTLHLLHEAEAARLLGIPADVTQTVLLPVGYMRDARLRPAGRREPHEVTYWNEWGVTRSR